MLIDISRVHTKVISVINGPIKKYTSREGVRERFDITFTDDYKAEYCPLVQQVMNLPKAGQSMTFKVKHHGQLGDEIELAEMERPISAEPGNVAAGRIFSMNGHPATIALQAATKLAEIKHPKGAGIINSDVLDDAEVFYEWLSMKANGI